MKAVMSTSSVLIRAAICAVFCFSVGGVMPAADHHATFAPKPLDIHVQANAFGKANPADITVVLQSAGSEIWQHCPRIQLDGIDVYHRTDHPQTDFKRTPSGRISIGLSTQDTYWGQYSFQFAHEFCHTLANFSDRSRQSARYPRTANLWLEESLCETASLFTLRAMSRSWLTAPPYPAWRGYAPSLNDYAQQRLTLPEHQIPAGKPFLDWFYEHHAALRRNSAVRDWNTIIAIQLLPLFEAEPRGWEAVTFLNSGSPDSNESLAQHLAEWRSACPEDLRPFVKRLAAIFEIKL
jgi:hypothetical protein